MKRFLITATLFILFINSMMGQFVSASFQQIGKRLPYQVMFPENYDETKQYPLLVFLHGAGERGNDNEKQLTHGKDFLIDNFRANYPAIVIVAQCPADDYWGNVQRHEIDGKSEFAFGLSDQPTESMQLLTSLVEWWLTSGKVDTKRVYAGGLSMGGMGTFELLWRMPTVFAAAFPICGGSALDRMEKYAQTTAVWIFHGEKDDVVSPELSRKAYNRLKELGCDAKYTEYEGVNHGSWVNVFQEKELVPWLFRHSK
ncbi:dienelactone hydrolase family protein [Dysgonomonas sp. Marseille-P4361]|uniref:carboxylesterase family protein n=1 Tax=Dysgonomonas sp. Marseille-P4361 TaxID=2161820 RepID=UPI000D55F5B9|nr:dienelactone hydrolase family protein [Dysgonomonas sp. Marseille-P4361]